MTADERDRKSCLIRTKTPGVYKRSSRYVVVYRCGGRQKKETVGTYAEARRIKAQHDASGPSARRRPRVTLEDHARSWLLLERRLGRMRSTSLDDYERRIKRWVLPRIGHRELAELRPSDISKLVADLNEARTDRGRLLGDETIACIVGTLRACLAGAVRDGLINTNPADGLRLRRRSVSPERWIPTTSEVAEFIDAVDAEHRLLFEILAVTGLRISEALGLQWRDLRVDDGGPCLVINRAWVRGQEHPPKSINGFRRIPVSMQVASRLSQQRRKSRFNEPDSFIFCSRTGRPLDVANLRRRVLTPAAQASGIPNLGFHDLRHFVASRVFARDNAKVAQVWLGHHSADFTLRTYVHLEGKGMRALSLPEKTEGFGTPRIAVGSP